MVQNDQNWVGRRFNISDGFANKSVTDVDWIAWNFSPMIIATGHLEISITKDAVKTILLDIEENNYILNFNWDWTNKINIAFMSLNCQLIKNKTKSTSEQ